MGCCILGAIIFGLLLRSWRRVRSWAGFAPAAEAPALWRLGQAGPTAITVPDRPLISVRFATGMATVIALIVAGFTLHSRMAHVRVDLAYAAQALDLPVKAILSLCGA